MATTIEEIEEFDSLFSEVLYSGEFKMTTPVTTKVKSNIDYVMKSKGDKRMAIEALVSHIKHKVHFICLIYNYFSHNLGEADAIAIQIFKVSSKPSFFENK